jgi:hypothetical protein
MAKGESNKNPLIPNPKHEVRNPKQAPMSEFQMTETTHSVSNIWSLSFGFVSDFVLRISRFWCGHVALSQYLANHVPMHVGQTAVNAIVPNGQPLMVDPQQVQHGGVQVVAIRLVLYRLERELVAVAMGHARLDPGPAQPRDE